MHKIFYDKVYAHAWLGRFFADVSQEHIEAQQTDFVAGAMGGEKRYCGALPTAAHQRMLITEELFELRHQMLADSINEAAVPAELGEQWLRMDAAFRSSLCKKSEADCKKRFHTDELLLFGPR